ncbi:MAG: hypothetical protein ACO2PL_19395, partial [Armatimonadota bacterium]
QSFEKTRHNLSSVTSATNPYPPSPCCGEPVEPDEGGIGVCVGCGRRWQWVGTSWHPVDPGEFDPKEYGFPF